MGIGIFGSSFSRLESSSSRTACGSGGGSPLPGDPIPTNFKFLKTHEAGKYTVTEILYPDASNYEGRKIAIYKCDIKTLHKAIRLDPHFNEKTGKLVPIARFEPTEQGWNMALKLMEILNNE